METREVEILKIQASNVLALVMIYLYCIAWTMSNPSAIAITFSLLFLTLRFDAKQKEGEKERFKE